MNALDGVVFRSAEDVVEVVGRVGFLPLFAGTLPGLSVEEHTPHDMWFVKDVDGPWEWKGPIVRSGVVAYAKYFRGKAVFVAREWLPRLVNFRRPSRPMSYDEERVLASIVANESMLSKEIREECGFGAHGQTAAERMMLARIEGGAAPAASLEAVLTKLQMGGRIVVSDFEYSVDRRGRSYGWGMARYSTPEILYADWFEMPDETPEWSRAMVERQLRSVCPDATWKYLDRLLK